jgi:hypothetical protein
MPAELIVNCPEHLAAVREFADKTNQRAQLEEKLDQLTRYLNNPGWTVELYTDFAPMSFIWAEYSPEHQRGMLGGLIYHGAHDGGGNGSAPTFSVNLTPSNGWSIHT